MPSLREGGVEAMAQTMHAEPLDELHPEDRYAAWATADQMLDAFLSYLTEHADEWAEAAASPLTVPGDVFDLLAVLSSHLNTEEANQ